MTPEMLEDLYKQTVFSRSIKTKWQEVFSRVRTIAWSSFYVGVAFLLQELTAVSLPDITIGQLVIPSAVATTFFGYVLAQVSKGFSNYTAGKVR